MSDGQQIRSDGDDGVAQAELSMLRPNQPAVTPVYGSRAVPHAGWPPNLQDAPIPSRDSTIRRKALELYRENPHLTPADRRAVVRYLQLCRLIENTAENLKRQGMFKLDGDPRKSNDLLTRYMAECRAHEKDMGLTAASRAALGVSVGRLLDLAAVMAEGAK